MWVASIHGSNVKDAPVASIEGKIASAESQWQTYGSFPCGSRLCFPELCEDDIRLSNKTYLGFARFNYYNRGQDGSDSFTFKDGRRSPEDSPTLSLVAA
ncbi:hypothetical protein NL676_020793 [Syzygium grande]|nr:hypothetical protein NL676_020793 [Syzygium grande]